ncbi:histone H2A.V-like [Drosophila takahashii]|uniref:histone H2A.V-like n=1 Tax=Drosophila takahashii TaxID=29030 RepID=UPI001CF89E72|nr:histone H2A.V-like [Drosophila takahashii]
MPGKTAEKASGKDKPKTKAKAKPVSQSSRAQITFPVARVHRQLKKHNTSKMRIGATAAVTTAAVLDYLTAEILECAGYTAQKFNVKRITPRHLQLAIRADQELDTLITATISGGGVIPHIHRFLTNEKNGSGSKDRDPEEDEEATSSQAY